MKLKLLINAADFPLVCYRVNVATQADQITAWGSVCCFTEVYLFLRLNCPKTYKFVSSP